MDYILICEMVLLSPTKTDYVTQWPEPTSAPSIGKLLCYVSIVDELQLSHQVSTLISYESFISPHST
jgi:hypothetical protein